MSVNHIYPLIPTGHFEPNFLTSSSDITGRSAEKLNTVKETYGKDIEGEIIPIPGHDVTSKDSIKKLVETIQSKEKCLCILVNNAGISTTSLQTESDSTKEMKKNLFEDDKSTFDDWTSAYSTNVAAYYFTTTAFLPLLQASTERHEGWSGTVLNITSISGMVQVAQHHFACKCPGSYHCSASLRGILLTIDPIDNASKGAAIHLTRMLASEIASNGHKIRVNSLAPGVFPSEMTAGESDEYQKSHSEQPQPQPLHHAASHESHLRCRKGRVY